MDIKKIVEVIKIIKRAKYKAYLIGGSSRDFLLQRNFFDVDIATNAPINFIKNSFEVVNDSGIQLGSLKIKYKDLIIDITKFREEKYDSSIYPKEVKFIDDEYLDSKRRDFTINAIYLDISTNEIVDPFDGVSDLLNHTLRFIGNPSDRIIEDPSRILRGLRIANKLNFLIPDELSKTFKELSNEILKLSKSKIHKEILKMINELGNEKTLKILKDYNLEALYEYK